MADHDKERIEVEIPSVLIEKAEELGVDISKSCRAHLRNRVGALEAMGSNGGSKVENIQILSDQREKDHDDPDDFLEDFEDYCRIDRDLADSTVRERMRYARKLVNHLGGHPLEADKRDLRSEVIRVLVNRSKTDLAKHEDKAFLDDSIQYIVKNVEG